jgi:hypothetical protein
LARQLLAPLGLGVMTGAQRDALGTPSDGWLIWNSDAERVERSRNGDWQALALDDDVNELVGLLALSLGRMRSALRYLDLEPELFDPDMEQLERGRR